MKLELQLETLSKAGLTLNQDITVDDLLHSFDRKNYEKKPFDLLLFMFGAEVERAPWGRPFCDQSWNFDTECIYNTGDYVSIVKQLCRMANCSKITNIEDFVDIESGKAWLKYQVGDKKRNWTVEVDNDWADAMTVSYLMDDVAEGDHGFYFKDNGQAMVLFYLKESVASTINDLTNNVLQPL